MATWGLNRTNRPDFISSDRVLVVSDSGILLSTCAGTGATLVAIVGGLLVSRYLTLESESLGAKKLVQSLEEKLDRAQKQADASQHSYERFELYEALTDDDILEEFLAAAPAGGLSTKVVAAKLSGEEFGADAVTEAAEEFNVEAKRVRAFNWDLVPYRDEHAYWEDFARQHNIHPEIDEMWELLYIEVCKQRPSAEAKPYFSVPVIDPATMGIVSIPEQNRRRDIRNRLTDARDVDRAEVRRLVAALAAAVTERDSLEQPPGLVSGLVVLAFLTVTSVVIPVLLLAPTPATLTYGESTAVVGLFIGGIVTLFVYLGSHVHRLRVLRTVVSATPQNQDHVSGSPEVSPTEQNKGMSDNVTA